MTIRLVDAGWGKELTDAVRADPSELRIICPFIKAGALERFLSQQPNKVQVITRFNLNDFAEGVSDIEALRRLMDYGAVVRGIRNLHSKVYLFGASLAIITSANLTKSALDRNQEFGLVAEGGATFNSCAAYFDDLWEKGKKDLTLAQLDEWDEKVTNQQVSGGRRNSQYNLGDFGEDAGVEEPTVVHQIPVAIADASQAFVKFLGTSADRVAKSTPTIDEIKRAGCHWALAYPPNKRPRSVQDGAIMFIGRLTDEPDIRIFGRAVGMKHVPGRDDASPDEIAMRPWKEKWPRYVRVYDAEFLAGEMGNGVSLNLLMDELGENSFASTQRNALAGEGGNTDPRRAYSQKASVELSDLGLNWLRDRLQLGFEQYGKLPKTTLEQLDWPRDI